MKEKMLTKLERDRAVGQVAGLQSTLKNMEGLRVGSGGTKLGQRKSFRKLKLKNIPIRPILSGTFASKSYRPLLALYGLVPCKSAQLLCYCATCWHCATP